MLRYAGIGNRTIDEFYFEFLESLALFLSQEYTLCSGGAKGSDSAFEFGARGKANIFRASDATPESILLASKYHGNWDKCDDYTKKLHGRNAMIILGKDLNWPVEFVICYAINETRGGTSLGLKIASDHKIPVFNVAKAEGYEEFKEYLNKRNSVKIEKSLKEKL